MPRAIHHQSLKTWSTPSLDHAMPPKNGAASPDVSPAAGADLPSVSVLIVRVATASGKKVEYIKPRSAWYKRTLALRAARATVRMIAEVRFGASTRFTCGVA